MNFFRKIFRSKKRSRAHTDAQRYVSDYNEARGYYNNADDKGDYKISRDDAFLPPRFPEANTNRPMISRLPDNVLDRIFTFVCPHATDHSYLSAEETATEAGCMLCDMRDLARCGTVNRRWHRIAEPLQYTSIRLDSVHYCGLEEELETKRKRGSFFQKKHEAPVEVPEMRMRLLYRTFQENERIACLVQYLRVPYMTRETCIADHARLVSLTPEMRYCDMAEGVYSDDNTCVGLKAILYARCPELRKMTWTTGSEKNFADLWQQQPWRNLEVVKLDSMRIENGDLLRVLNSLPALHDLTLKSLPWITDNIFTPTFAGSFPALQTLILDDLETLSSAALLSYLNRPIVSASLTSLSILNTPLPPGSLASILLAATSLESLHYATTVTRAFSDSSPEPLRSTSLRKLHYEITPCASVKGLSTPPHQATTTTLASSILSQSLPQLCALYVRESEFVDRLEGHLVSFSVPLTVHTNGFLQAWGEGELLVPPSPGFRRDPVGSRPGSRGSEYGRDQQSPGPRLMLAVPGSPRQGGFGGLVMPSPGFGKKERRGSRQDLWR
ncbi:hypothetical protein FPQ18DRAFT_367233 [Pyronema domesticum]|nr:hypothetical protein FPQ18DRAFT_367233 [Pyronema domesticum]